MARLIHNAIQYNTHFTCYRGQKAEYRDMEIISFKIMLCILPCRCPNNVFFASCCLNDSLMKTSASVVYEQMQLVSKIRDETIKGRQAELKHNQELIQLRKEQRIKDSQIRSLEADKRQKEVILRRKQEEVSAAIHSRFTD